MKNCTWIIYILTALVAGSCSSKKQNQRSKTDLPPPSILRITCEDISPASGCYGDPCASTPRLDSLAGEGILYTRAYASVPGRGMGPLQGLAVSDVHRVCSGSDLS